MTDMVTARAALAATREDLLKRANVVATGVGYKVSAGRKTATLSVVCSVTHKLPRAQLAPRDLVPPAPGGVSIGHRDITAGTLGGVVRRNGEILILSNNHVLANSNAADRGDRTRRATQAEAVLSASLTAQGQHRVRAAGRPQTG